MLASIVYMIGCAVIAGLLASALVMVRPIKDRDETKPWRTFLFCYIFVMAAPYGYIETITRMHPEIESAVKQGYATAATDNKMNGPVKYFRITKYGAESAKLIVVGTDKGEWGSDSPVISVEARKRSDGTWYAYSYKVLTSGKLNQDNMVLPPFF